MAHTNYTFIGVNIDISFCIACTFRTLFINLSYTGVFGHSLSHFFKKKNIISICYQMDVLAIR